MILCLYFLIYDVMRYIIAECVEVIEFFMLYSKCGWDLEYIIAPFNGMYEHRLIVRLSIALNEVYKDQKVNTSHIVLGIYR